jgi:hypothetical protein
MDEKQKLIPFDGTASKAEIKDFQTRIGTLIWLMVSTRPDISFVVIKLARWHDRVLRDFLEDKVSSRALLFMKYVPTSIRASLVLHSEYNTKPEATLPVNLESSNVILRSVSRQHGLFSDR